MTGINIDEVRERKALKQRYRQYFQGWHEEEKKERAWLAAGRVLSAFLPALYLEEVSHDLVGSGDPEAGCTWKEKAVDIYVPRRSSSDSKI
jgi:hypothetical protein